LTVSLVNNKFITVVVKSVCAELWMLQWVKGGSMHPLFTWAPWSPTYG